MVKYLDEVIRKYKIAEKPVERHGGTLRLLPGQGQDGYGNKISTDKVVIIGGKEHRVYATCISNVSSCWITHNRQKLFLRDCE